MKFSAVVALSIAALASAQEPKGSGTGTGTGSPQLPAGVKCAATCLAPLKQAGCKLDGLIPKGTGSSSGPPGDLTKPAGSAKPTGGATAGGAAAGGAAAGGEMAGMNMVRRQTDPAKAAPPKISPDTIAAAKSARDCLCASPALKTAQTCITSSCASSPDGGAAAVKGINAICKGVSSFTPLQPATPAAGGAGAAAAGAGAGATPPKSPPKTPTV